MVGSVAGRGRTVPCQAGAASRDGGDGFLDSEATRPPSPPTAAHITSCRSSGSVADASCGVWTYLK